MVQMCENQLAGKIGEEGQGFGDQGMNGDGTAAYFVGAVKGGIGQNGVYLGEGFPGFGPEMPFVDVG